MKTDTVAEITVESALKELREMFPHHMVDIQIRTGPNAKYVRVDIWSLGFMRDAPTMDEALQKIRAWKERQ